MNVSREAIMTALCNKVFAVSNFQTTGRRVLLWSQVADQPACFVRNIGDRYEFRNNILAYVVMRCEIWIYSKSGADPNTAPGIDLNNLVDAVETAFVADDPARHRVTLGGLVHDCKIEGESVFDPGDLDGQAKAILSVHLTVPWTR